MFQMCSDTLSTSEKSSLHGYALHWLTMVHSPNFLLFFHSVQSHCVRRITLNHYSSIKATESSSCIQIKLT